jgi:hypothetical protein
MQWLLQYSFVLLLTDRFAGGLFFIWAPANKIVSGHILLPILLLVA